MHGVAMVDTYPELDETLRKYPDVWAAIFDSYRIFDQITNQTTKSLIDDDIVDQLGNINYCDSTNPCDRVYGLLGLLPEKLASSIKPDYNLPVHVVFEDFTVKMLQHTRSLGLLRLCGGKREKELPSWVPDFRYLSHRGYWTHKAAEGAFHFLEQTKPRELEVYAYFADKVLAVSTASVEVRLYEMLDGDESRRLKMTIQSWRSDRIQYFNMLREETRQSRMSLSRFVADEPINLLDSRNGEYPQELVNRFRRWSDQSIPALIEGVHKDERLSTLRTVDGEAFFVTRAGRLGLAYATPQLGDLVTVLAGSGYAMVLRRSTASKYGKCEVVTPCYCDGKYWSRQLVVRLKVDTVLGMMRGEAIREAAEVQYGDESKFPDVFSQITLV